MQSDHDLVLAAYFTMSFTPHVKAMCIPVLTVAKVFAVWKNQSRLLEERTQEILHR
jgi:hypothetical protein